MLSSQSSVRVPSAETRAPFPGTYEPSSRGKRSLDSSEDRAAMRSSAATHHHQNDRATRPRTSKLSNRTQRALPRRERARIASLASTQRLQEVKMAREKALCRTHRILRQYSSFESSRHDVLNKLLIPIQIVYKEAEVEKLLYRKNGKKVALVVFGNVRHDDDRAELWKSKHDEIERLCSKVSVPFLSLRNASKLRSYVSLDDEYKARSLCGIIVSVNVPSVWDDVASLHQEIVHARMLKSFVQELECMNSRTKPALDAISKLEHSSSEPSLELPVTSRLGPTGDEELSSVRSSNSLSTTAMDDSKSKEAKQLQTAESRQPNSESNVQRDEAIFLTVCNVGEPTEVSGALPVSGNGDVGDNRQLSIQTSDNSPTNTELAVSVLLQDDADEVTPEFRSQIAKLPQSQITKEEPVPCGQVKEAPVETELAFDSNTRHQPVCFYSGAGVSLDERNRAWTVQINVLEVQALLFESNVESLSSLQLAIDQEIERSLGRLGDQSFRNSSAESLLSASRDVLEQEARRLDLIRAILAENEDRLASLMSDDLPLETVARLRDGAEALSEQPTLFGALGDGKELELDDMNATALAVVPD
jgi:hypothetical protein